MVDILNQEIYRQKQNTMTMTNTMKKEIPIFSTYTGTSHANNVEGEKYLKKLLWKNN